MIVILLYCFSCSVSIVSLNFIDFRYLCGYDHGKIIAAYAFVEEMHDKVLIKRGNEEQVINIRFLLPTYSWNDVFILK